MKTTVLLSGGVDSALCLALAQNFQHNVHAVFVNYGQAAWIPEARAAKAIARRAGVPIRTTRVSLDVRQMNVGAGESGPRIVPNRNLVLLSIAANLHPDSDELWLGATAEDADYPDCSQQFAVNATVALGITVRVPLVNMTRADVLRRAGELEVSTELCWSCYQPVKRDPGTFEPCGECNSCKQ